MATVITMPRLSDTMTEGTVATWLKKVGDKISEGDILAEIETDKATMEFESFNTGTLLYIGIPEGETAPIDSLLAIIGAEGEDIAALLNGSPAVAKEEVASEAVEAPKAQDLKTETTLPKGVVVVTMPRLSDTMTDGTVASWLKKIGDKVAEGDIRTQLKNILGCFMFSGDDIDKKVSMLSGGERTRLAMVKLLLEPVNLLILDEPTNHLDLRSKDVLKDALLAFDGTLILVSHDRDFLQGLAEKVFEFKDKRVLEHFESINDFLVRNRM